MKIAGIAGLILLYGLILKYQVISTEYLIITTLLALFTATYIEWNRRQLTREFRLQTKKKLSEQGERFHDELWVQIFKEKWGTESYYALKDLESEFREIYPSKKHSRTNPNYRKKAHTEHIALKSQCDAA